MMKKCQCGVAKVAGLLVVIGGLNWGLTGLGMLISKNMGWNVVHMLLGNMPMLEGIVYLLVGIATVMVIVGCKCKKCASCNVGGASADASKM